MQIIQKLRYLELLIFIKIKMYMYLSGRGGGGKELNKWKKMHLWRAGT